MASQGKGEDLRHGSQPAHIGDHVGDLGGYWRSLETSSGAGRVWATEARAAAKATATTATTATTTSRATTTTPTTPTTTPAAIATPKVF